MRIGLLGGSFNPIHKCHLQVAEQVHSIMQLDQVLFIPTGDPPHKPAGELAPAADRYEMVRLAIVHEPRFGISDIEINREGKCYTIDTVRQLRNRYGSGNEFYFIIGLDAFLEFPSWKDAPLLLRTCHFIVVSRPNVSFQSLTSLSLLTWLNRPDLMALDAGNKKRVDGSDGDSASLTLLCLPPCEVSASDIRRRLREGLSLVNLLPLPVESYIIQRGLFLEDADRTGISSQSPRDRQGGA